MIPFLANHIWQSSVFAVMIWLVATLLRKNRAGIRYGLWLGASVKFLLPFSLLMSLGSAIPWRSAPAAARPMAVVLAYAEPLPAATAKAPTPAGEKSQRFPQTLAGIWLVGFAITSGFCVRSWLRMRATLRGATRLDLTAAIPVLASPARIEPGVFGILRPVLLVPEGLTESLSHDQLNAIVQHEVCHVRRRDNLTGAIHLVAESIFWFHPLLWLIRGKLVEERERACDESVLRSGADPHVYAEGILNVCKAYLASPLVCAAGVSGSNLKRRIREIVENRRAIEMSFAKKLLVATAATAAIVAPIAIGMLHAPYAHAQAKPAPHLAFEVASIKEHKDNDREFHLDFLPNGNAIIRGFPLRAIILRAYGLTGPNDGIKGLPDGMGDVRYDIEAVAPAGAIPADASPRERSQRVRAMLQSLLAERFHAAIHVEEKEAPVYAVVVGDHGTKLAKSDLTEKDCEEEKPGCHEVMGGMGRGIHSKAGSIADLATWVSPWSDRPVIDKSGITGLYKFDTDGWVNMRAPMPQPPNGQPPTPEQLAMADPARPTLFQIFDRLGLKLDKQRAPVATIVVDSIQRPTEN